MIDFRMNTFIEVYENMSFTKAARELNITQPAVSQHIRFIEEHYGVKLFELEGKKLKVTPAGHKLYNSAIAMQNNEIYLQKHLKEQKDKKRRIVFGTTLTVGEYAMEQPLIKILKKRNDINISMLVNNTHSLLEQLIAGKLDFAIVEGHFDSQQVEHRTFSKEKYIAVCSQKHHFVLKPERLENLLNERIIVREEGSGTREIFERALKSRNHSINDITDMIEIGSLNVIKEMVKQDCGITFIYERAVKTELLDGSIKRIMLKDFNLIHDFSFIWSKESVFYDDINEIMNMITNNSEME